MCRASSRRTWRRCWASGSWRASTALGRSHGGRIDSLGLDENGSPVIVEYKRGVDAGVINQGLFYLAWLMDHRAEFEHLVRDRLGVTAASQVLWSGPRLICIAGDFTRYDVHAVREHRRSIDLVRYRLFGSDLLGLETVASVSGGMQVARRARRRAVARAAADVQGASMAELAGAVDEVLLGLGDGVNRVERKTVPGVSAAAELRLPVPAAAQQAAGLPEGRPEGRRPRSGLHPGRVRSRPPRDG